MTEHREIRFSDGYLGSNDPRLHFGLGEARRAETVSIRWSGGTAEKLGPIEAGLLHVVKQGRGVVARIPLD